MLRDDEKELPRRQRRAILSDRRGTIKKNTPFGRVRVRLGKNEGRIGYLHFTKGPVDRRETFPLLTRLISIG